MAVPGGGFPQFDPMQYQQVSGQHPMSGQHPALPAPSDQVPSAPIQPSDPWQTPYS